MNIMPALNMNLDEKLDQYLSKIKNLLEIAACNEEETFDERAHFYLMAIRDQATKAAETYQELKKMYSLELH